MKKALVLLLAFAALPAFAAKPSPRPAKKAPLPVVRPFKPKPLLPSPNAIYFPGLSSKLDVNGAKKLGGLAQGISRSKWKSIELIAHSYRCGNAKACQEIQHERINAVRTALIQKGFPPSKINGISFGQSLPGPGQAKDALVYFQKVDIVVMK
jgi:outer membrane protein OmpA-like peptidoglycan-associated protein